MEMYGLRLEKMPPARRRQRPGHPKPPETPERKRRGRGKETFGKAGQRAVEKLDSEIREINREYFQATYEAQYSDNARNGKARSRLPGKTGRRRLVEAYEKTRQPFRKGRNAMWGRLSRNRKKGWP